MLTKDVTKKPSDAEYRKRRVEREHEFEECKKPMNLQKYFTSELLRMAHVNKVKLQLLYHLRTALNWL
jgi:hypothetical protein